MTTLASSRNQRAKEPLLRGRAHRSAALARPDVIDRIRAIARATTAPVEARSLPTDLWRAARRHFGSIGAARDAAGVASPDRNYRWTQTLVIEEIRRVWRQGVVITETELEKAGRYDLLGGIENHIGSIVKARRLAGVPGPPKVFRRRERWDEQRVILEIEERDRGNEPLAKSKAPVALVKAAQRYYGSWQKAIEAAGLDYDAIRLQHAPYTKDEILAKIRKLAAARPNLLQSEFYAEPYHPAVTRLFGSVEEAARRAGLTDWPKRLRERAMSPKGVRAGLRARKRAGKPTHWQAVQSEDFHLWYSGMQHFGDWLRAVEASGLDDDSPQGRWSRETLLDALRQRVRDGLSMRPADLQRDDRRLFFSVRPYFGSYLAVLDEIGYDPPWALRRWTPDLVLAAVRQTAGRSRRLTARQAGAPLVAAAQARYGSFSAACRAAGVACGPGGRPAHAGSHRGRQNPVRKQQIQRDPPRRKFV